MAEVAGLVLSSLAVTSLLTSCVELLEYFETGRYWVYDLSTALTKVQLLRARLTLLEASVSPAVTEKGQCVSEPNPTQVVMDGLSGINTILDRTNHLCQRYSYNAVALSLSTPSCISDKVAATNGASPRASGWQLWGKRLCWTVKDKRRFESLIVDLDFLLSNLEQVVWPFREDIQSNSGHSDTSSSGGIAIEGREPVPRQLSIAASMAPSADNQASPHPTSDTRASTTSHHDTTASTSKHTMVGCVVGDDALVVAGGFISETGNAVETGSVYTANTKFTDRSVTSLRSLESKDLKELLKYKLEAMKIPSSPIKIDASLKDQGSTWQGTGTSGRRLWD